MTVIIGLIHRDQVWMGGDSAGVTGWSLTTRSDAKVFQAHGFIYGFTTSFRMGDLLRYRFKPPKRPDGDLHRYMATDWIDALRECFKAHSFGKTDNGEQTGGNFLVGHGSSLFEVGSDFQVGIPRCGFAAVGCGSDLALGAIYATSGHGPRRRIHTALLAAEAMSAGVRAPFTIERLNRTP